MIGFQLIVVNNYLQVKLANMRLPFTVSREKKVDIFALHKAIKESPKNFEVLQEHEVLRNFRDRDYGRFVKMRHGLKGCCSRVEVFREDMLAAELLTENSYLPDLLSHPTMIECGVLKMEHIDFTTVGAELCEAFGPYCEYGVSEEMESLARRALNTPNLYSSLSGDIQPEHLWFAIGKVLQTKTL